MKARSASHSRARVRHSVHAPRAAELNCSGPANVEEFHYAWHLRGGLGWVAGLVFPAPAYGDLKTIYPNAGSRRLIEASC